MPSPVAHGLAGLALAHFAIRNGFVATKWRFWVATLACAATAPDLDFVPGLVIGDAYRFHHGATHTVIAALPFGLIVGGAARLSGFREWRSLALLAGLAYLSHLLFDVFTIETTEPYGMDLLWPFSDHAVRMPFHVFSDIRRDPAAPNFLVGQLHWHNALAVVWELVVMGGFWAVYQAAASSAAFLIGRSARQGTSAR